MSVRGAAGAVPGCDGVRDAARPRRSPGSVPPLLRGRSRGGRRLGRALLEEFRDWPGRRKKPIRQRRHGEGQRARGTRCFCTKTILRGLFLSLRERRGQGRILPAGASRVPRIPQPLPRASFPRVPGTQGPPRALPSPSPAAAPGAGCRASGWLPKFGCVSWRGSLCYCALKWREEPDTGEFDIFLEYLSIGLIT